MDLLSSSSRRLQNRFCPYLSFGHFRQRVLQSKTLRPSERWNLVGGVVVRCRKCWRSGRGHPRSNGVKPLRIVVWRWNLVGGVVVRCRKGQFNVTGVIDGQMVYHCCMDLKLGGWSHFLIPTCLKVSWRSSGVAQGQMVYHLCMNMHLGGSRHFKCWNCGVQFQVTRGHPWWNGLSLLYGLETWWVDSSVQ